MRQKQSRENLWLTGLGTGIHVAPRAPWQPGQGPCPQGLGLCPPVPEQEVLNPAFGALMDQLGKTGAGHGYLAKLETCTAHKVPYPAPCGCAFSPVRVSSGLSGKEGKFPYPGLCLTVGPEVETAS